MRGFRLKPNNKKIDLQELNVDHIDFICNMGIINKIIAKRKGIPWSYDIQNQFDADIKVYFLVKKNLEYDVLYGKDIDELIISKGLFLNKIVSDKGKKCIDHFIKTIV